ncbi:MAG: JDVT-CTERM system glutamic-type intramembrane protease [Magnetococcus sp. YQC-5]
MNRLFGDRLFWLALLVAPVTVYGLDWVWPHPAKIPGFPILQIIVYPILEELTFRGLIQSWLLEQTRWRFHAFSLANLLTSLLFVAAHLLVRKHWIMVTVLVPSLIFGFFRERHDRIYPCIVLHVYYNIVYFLY